jgi:cytochrome P450 family 9
MDFGLIILWVVIVGLWLLYKIAFLNEDYFKKRGVLYAKPKPFFGNLTKFFFNKKNFHSILTHHYKQFKSARFFGVFNLRQPVYIIRDPDLVKQITIKDFDHFTDHADFINEHVDPIFGRILLFLKGQRWKSMRSALSPIFTSSKMKMMFHILLEDAKDFTDYFLEKADKGGRVIIDGKDVMARFTVSGISHCVFGIKANCLRDKDESFYRNARNLVSLHFLMNLKIVFGNVFPRLYRLLGLKLVTDDGIRMGQEIVVDAIKYREENNIVRPDVLHLLMEVKKGNLKYEETVETEDNSFSAHKEYITDAHTTKAPIWTEPDIIAQGLVIYDLYFKKVHP